MIQYTALTEAARQLLAYARQTAIPYTGGGMTLAGMDCQGLCEYLLMQCGLSRDEVNLAGSNAHWRKSLKWRGTVEEAVALFGEIPEGAWLFIHEDGPNSKYGDMGGDASHMGQYIGSLQAVHASASRGQVAESAAKNKSINGGWNRVGMNRWTVFAPAVEDRLGASPADGAPAVSELEKGEAPADGAPAVSELEKGEAPAVSELGEGEALPVPVPIPPAPAQFATVTASNGKPVNMRATPSKKERLYWAVPRGTRVEVLGQKAGGWTKIRHNGRKGYMLAQYLRMEG